MGGSARRWTGELRAAVFAGAVVRLRLVMTKFGDPSVRIRWTVRVDRNVVTSRTR